MYSSDPEIVRRVLAALLNRLEADGGDKSADQASTSQSKTTVDPNHSIPGVPPLIVVVLAQDNAAPARPVVNDDCRPHPGLERFPLGETTSPDEAPKTCFMEPNRICVNSGACEMRGY